MSQIGAVLAGLRASLAAGFPARVVSGTLLDFGERSEEDLVAGVYTVLADGQPPPIEDYREFVGVMLVGQVLLEEDAGGAAVEEAELTMIDELKALRRAASVQVAIESIQQSRQLEAPYGWIRAALRVGPFDFTPLAEGGQITPFELFHADWDVPPFQPGTEHGKWLEEPPDHATSTPDADDDVALEQPP